MTTRFVFGAAFSIFSAALLGCSSGDTDSDTPATADSGVSTGDSSSTVVEDSGVVTDTDAQSSTDDSGTSMADAASETDGAATATDGISASIDGTGFTFTKSQTVTMTFVSGAGSPPFSATMTAGGDAMKTMLVKVSAKGVDSLVPGTYTCGGGMANQVQYVEPGVATFQATGSTGSCSIVLTDVGNKTGDRVKGTFTATMVKIGGSEMKTVTNGTFNFIRMIN